MSRTNPVDITLNQANPISDEYIIKDTFIGKSVQFSISGVFDGASVQIQSYVSDFQGWQPLTFRADESTSNTLIYNTQTNSDLIDLPFIGKIRVVCTEITGLTNLKANFTYYA